MQSNINKILISGLGMCPVSHCIPIVKWRNYGLLQSFRFLLGQCYSLWFLYLPTFIQNKSHNEQINIGNECLLVSPYSVQSLVFLCRLFTNYFVSFWKQFVVEMFLLLMR